MAAMDFDTFAPVLLVVIAVIGVALAAMSVGVMFKRPCLRGSCGGAALRGPDGESLSCANCPRRRAGSERSAV